MTVSKACCPAQVRETVRDVKLLHNEQFFAAAQKKYVYIYDKRGLEVHCLKVRVSSCLKSEVQVGVGSLQFLSNPRTALVLDAAQQALLMDGS